MAVIQGTKGLLSGSSAPVNGTDATQTLTVSGASEGKYRLRFEGFVTADLDYNANASAIQTALRALPSIGSAGIGVTSTGPWTLTFADSLGKQPQPLIEVVFNSTDGTVTIAAGVTGVLATGKGSNPGTQYRDTTTGKFYRNVGTAKAPVWVSEDSYRLSVGTAHTANATLLASDSGSIHTNAGAQGAVTLTLPAAKVGLEFLFRVEAAQALNLDPAGTEVIALPSTGVNGAAGKYLGSSTAGESVHLVCTKDGSWSVAGYTGSGWAAESP